MEAPDIEFQIARETLYTIINECVQATDRQEGQQVKKIEECFSSLIASPAEKKAAVDQAFRDVLKDVIKKEGQSDEFFAVINLAATAVSSEMTSAAILFVLMQDMFDCITLNKCEDMFCYLEDRVAMWKSDTYYNAGKNYLLRMCNDLLRRLSRSKNTVFCGRIQLFLAKLFPLSEKSGLNLMSQFNLENITLYNMKAEDYERLRKQSVEEYDESMEIEEGETDDHPSNIPIDYNLYRKFWSLQDYFRKPVQCYDKTAWKNFISHSDDVLSCFESFKLDDVKANKKQKNKKKKGDDKKAEVMDTGLTTSKGDHVYFPKYLTSEKLLDLQLSDSNFRRNMLVQLLIIFQYLQAPVKFKSTAHVVSDEQTAWIKETFSRVMKVLKETPPDGDKFAEIVQHMLLREDNWNNWKNDGCPSFVRETEPTKSAPSGSRKRSIGDDLKYSGGKLIKMGNSELTRLWNLCPDNMGACKNKQLNILPTPEEFFEDAIDQMDPEAMIEEEYKMVKQSTYAWKSLRLLSRKSPHFFAQTPNQQKKKSMAEYLEGMLDKLAKEMPSSQNEEMKTEVDDSVEQETGDTAMQEDQLDNKQDDDDDSQNRDESSTFITKDHIQELAARLTEDWRKLGTELGIPQDEMDYFESEKSENEPAAAKMLTVWAENEVEKSTVDVVRNALKEIGQDVIATDIFGEREES